MDHETVALRNWDDVVFAHRHKAYGAYTIRQAYLSSIIFGLGASMVMASLLIMLPQIISILGYELHKPAPLAQAIPELSFTCNLPLPPPPAKRKVSQTFVNAVPIVSATEVGTRPPKNKTELVSSIAEINSLQKKTHRDLTIIQPAEEIYCYFPTIEETPHFPNGYRGITDFVSKNIRYPPSAQQMGIEGTVFVTFTIKEDGRIDNIKCIRGVHPNLNEEAIRVVSLMNGWIPAKQNGRNVPVRMTLPIKFELTH